MKQIRRYTDWGWMALAVLLWAAISYSQEGVPSPPKPDPDLNTQRAIFAALTAMTPVVISALRRLAVRFIPRMPTVVLPYLAVVIGPLLNLFVEVLTGSSLGDLASVGAGITGIGAREQLDQAIKFVSPSKPTKTVGDSAKEAEREAKTG